MPISGANIPAGTTIASIVSSSAITMSANCTSGASQTIYYKAIGSPMQNTGVGSNSIGYAYLKLKNNYGRYAGGFSGYVSPTTGSTSVAINSTALTVGQPYLITSVGHGAAGACTYAPVADSSGSLAGTYFQLFDSYGNVYIIWFSVTGVGGVQPVGVQGIPIQVTIAQNAAATAITTAVSNAVLLISSAIAGVNLPTGVAPFTESGAGGATLTLTSTANLPLAGAPQDGAGSLATGATFALTVYNTNLTNWQKVGLPVGVIPNVGASFVAQATGSSTGGGSTGTVAAIGVSGVTGIEVLGDANQSLAPVPMGGSPNVGALILVQFLAPVVTIPVTSGTSGNAVTLNAGTTLEATGGGTVATTLTMTPTAPANNTVVGMSFYVDQSSVVINGD